MALLGVGAAGLIVVYCLTWQPSVNLFNGKGCVVKQSVSNRILLTEFTYSTLLIETCGCRRLTSTLSYVCTAPSHP
jgi:hypothetical protein